jgi:aromatic ring-opening dioxygenase catalytic subunit (LigB family)
VPGLSGKAPEALIVISAHWEEPVPTVISSAKPPILYDYYGMPPEAYALTWPAPGNPASPLACAIFSRAPASRPPRIGARL